MATKKSSPNAPGTYVDRGVRCTQGSPFNKATAGSQQNMGAPFDAGRAGGDNGLPTRTYDSIGGQGKAPTVNSVSSLGTIRTDPNGPRR